MALKPERKFRIQTVDPFLKKLKNCKSFSIQQVAISGTPDKLLCINGKFVALELKDKGKKPSKIQKYNLDGVVEAGGVSIVASLNNWEEVKKILLQLDKGEYHGNQTYYENV